MNKIEIPLDKTKIIFLAVGSLAFVILGFLCVQVVSEKSVFLPPIIAKIIGILAIVFFGYTGFISLKMLQNKKPGLVIDDSGILINSSAIEIGKVSWEDVTGFRTQQIMSSKFILIDVKNPDEYISKLNKHSKMLKKSMELYGTPLSISANTLKISFNELKNTLESELQKRS